MAELIIDDTFDVSHAVLSEGPRGLIPRPVNQPVRATPFNPDKIKLIPREEWPDRIADMQRTKRRLSDIALGAGLKSKDQNDPKYMHSSLPRWGYCWMYQAVTGLETMRAVMGQPRVVLSAFGAAYTIKHGADEGGWGALALDFLMDKGCPSEDVWPNFDTSPKDQAAVWADAAKYKIDSAFADLSSPVYDRNLTLDQKMTLLLQNVPVFNDYMWWGHAVCSFDPVDVDPTLKLTDVNRWGSRDRNTWGDSYGDRGFFIVRGQRCVPDNAVAPITTLAS